MTAFSAGHRSVAVFCMSETGHFQRLQSLISGLTQNGLVVNVFTDCMFKPQVERAGGVFFDLFSKYPLEQADDASLPVPCRFVTFAATYGRQICRDVEKTKPSLVIHDSFAVIGRVVATLLGIPRVNTCAGHNVDPTRFLALLREDPRVKLSAKCLQAVKVLQDSCGMSDASPFSYVSSLSPHLNLYCEPPEFLEESERKVFEPVAYYGSLPSVREVQDEVQRDRVRVRKVYVCFGTVVWRYYTPVALDALTTLAAAFSRMKNTQAVISLGTTTLEKKTIAALSRPNVSVENCVDQRKALQEADIFVTHQGMNSTHEAIFHRVPMVSYPFFWDQPSLAKKCQQFGLAIPLVNSLRGVVSEDDVHAAFAKLDNERDSMRAALSRAYEWERRVMENRPAVLKRVVDLMS